MFFHKKYYYTYLNVKNILSIKTCEYIMHAIPSVSTHFQVNYVIKPTIHVYVFRLIFIHRNFFGGWKP